MLAIAFRSGPQRSILLVPGKLSELLAIGSTEAPQDFNAGRAADGALALVPLSIGMPLSACILVSIEQTVESITKLLGEILLGAFLGL